MVSQPKDVAVELAERIRAALSAEDVEAFADLLDPAATWGAPGDPHPPCRNRRQVIEWFRRGRAAGRHGAVLDVTSSGDKLLVAMTSVPGAPVADRWQVLTITEGRISDIRGYDDHTAATAAYQPSSSATE
jgi:ketosteroid isomerase-like protein